MKKEIKKQQKKGPSTSLVNAGYILSIVSVATAIIGIGLWPGIPGLVTSIIGRSRVTDPLLKKKGTKGMIMSIVGIAVGIIMTIAWIITIIVLLWKYVFW